VLLVCPKPLVTNWQREFQLWAPEVPLLSIEGDRDKRRWQWQSTDVPVKIANYELLCRDHEVLAEPAARFDLVVLDEAQRIKNRASTTAQVVRSIQRRRSWALTGTPVENSPEDLVGIFEFIAPGHLSPRMKPRRMGRLAADHMLRRTKERVLADLPPKLFRDADVELTEQQRETYRLAEEEGVLRLSAMGEGATIQHVFELVLRLKQICNFDPATGESAKLERLTADIEEVAASGQKALVFSQWVGTLETLARRLARYGTLQFHGQISTRQRDAVIPQFRADSRRHVPELAVRQLRVSLRSLVEPGGRGPGRQPRAPHRRVGPGDGDALPRGRYDRGAHRPDSAREARGLRHNLFRRADRRAPRADPAGDLRPVQAQVPSRTGSPGGLSALLTWRS
jgi:SNF2 family DNA or RNA helicase